MGISASNQIYFTLPGKKYSIVAYTGLDGNLGSWLTDGRKRLIRSKGNSNRSATHL
jgi:hypothetical protein